ncbi:MAG TPA: bacillithiol biosynthesis cysteine-adding enzyme BshC [Ignavibacteriaceae bacterium]|nr:bacillithiol biosynthesis cysteine-adding enzyme BshC [Ignavibacteriaceae bacterium]
MFIKFSDIPGSHNLFLDYLYEFNNVKKYYNTDFRNTSEYPTHLKKVADHSRPHKQELYSIIKNQYKDKNPSEKTKQLIEFLKEENSLAIVTGQQVGIIGGPLYTIFKVITGIKLAEQLNSQYLDYKFFPVFWLEADDHDFEEIASINLINQDNNLTTISYPLPEEEESNKGSVGYLKIEKEIDTFFEQFDASLRNTEFKTEILNKLKSFYCIGKTFKEAFSELLFDLFDEKGLIIFDPQDKEVKRLLKPVFKNEAANYRTHSEKLIAVSAELEETYHAQVKVRPFNLFYNYEEGRYLIEPVDNEFKLKRKRKKFSYDELIQSIENEYYNFSPNVLLRPICQDYLFPTAFYVGGPSEVSYFAQVNVLYPLFDIPSPIIYPRSSATIVEKNISTITQKFNLEARNIFILNETLKDKVIAELSDNSLSDLFDNSQKEVDAIFDKLKEYLFNIDKTISDASDKYRQKAVNSISELKNKSLDAQKNKYDVVSKQIDKILIAYMPNSNLQEREINIFYFINKYGFDVLNKIIDELDIQKFEHQIINL